MNVLKLINPPKIIMNYMAFAKISRALDNHDIEFTFLGPVELDGNNYRIKDIYFPPQENTSTTTEITEEEMIEWSQELGPEIANSLRFYGHSHVNMATNPSGTDLKTVEEFIQQYQLCIQFIVNKRWEIFLKLFDSSRFIIEKMPLYVEKEGILLEILGKNSYKVVSLSQEITINENGVYETDKIKWNIFEGDVRFKLTEEERQEIKNSYDMLLKAESEPAKDTWTHPGPYSYTTPKALNTLPEYEACMKCRVYTRANELKFNEEIYKIRICNKCADMLDRAKQSTTDSTKKGKFKR